MDQGYYANTDQWKAERERVLQATDGVEDYAVLHAELARATKVVGGKHSFFLTPDEAAELNESATSEFQAPAVRSEAGVTTLQLPKFGAPGADLDTVKAAGLTTVGLLATAYTMEQDFYRARLASHGVCALIPQPADRAEVQRIIYEELCAGIIDDGSRERLIAVARSLVDAGGEGIVLGCTELELTIAPEHVEAPLFATTALHCTAALDRALG